MVIPTVTEAQTRAYEKQAWHLGCGVKPIIDNTTIRFATDWANVILKSFVAEYSAVIKKQVIDEIRAIRAIAQKKQAEQATPSPSGWTETPKGTVVLTD
jgi:hypothetical protein